MQGAIGEFSSRPGKTNNELCSFAERISIPTRSVNVRLRSERWISHLLNGWIISFKHRPTICSRKVRWSHIFRLHWLFAWVRPELNVVFSSLENDQKKNVTSLPRPPPIPPRQTKADEKTTTTPSPLSSLVLVKQSNPAATSSSNESNSVNTSKGLPVDKQTFSSERKHRALTEFRIVQWQAGSTVAHSNVTSEGLQWVSEALQPEGFLIPDMLSDPLVPPSHQSTAKWTVHRSATPWPIVSPPSFSR